MRGEFKSTPSAIQQHPSRLHQFFNIKLFHLHKCLYYTLGFFEGHSEAWVNGGYMGVSAVILEFLKTEQ